MKTISQPENKTTTTFDYKAAVRHVDDEEELLMFSVKNRLLKGDENEFEIYMFKGSLLHDDVVHEKRHASVVANRGLPSPLQVMGNMSAEEFSALRKRVARSLWCGDHSK